MIYKIDISIHARERISERIGCKDDKICKLVWKAWEKGKIVSGKNYKSYLDKFNNKKIIRKEILGKEFVFQIFDNQGKAILITVI